MRPLYIALFVILGIGVVFLAMLAAVAIERGPYERQGPRTDSEAACWATDLTPAARTRLGCK